MSTSPASASTVIDLFSATGAYLKGHFRLTSGLHSAEYLQCAKVLAWPRYAEQLGRDLALALESLLCGASADAIVSPAIGGLIIGHEVARALNIRALFTERDPGTRSMSLRRGFSVEPGSHAVVIEDVVTTGGSTREVIQHLQSRGVSVLAAGCIIDRSGGQADVGVPHTALQTMTAITYPPESCPLCLQGLPVVKPGSRPT